MNRKLLEKVEELTLYVIRLNTENTELCKQMQSLGDEGKAWDGLDLTEMDLLFLTKVEELTLHLIELKKELKVIRDDTQK